MYTSILVVALSGVVAATPQSTDRSVWLTDYGVAYAKGQSERKPLALVFGTGADGANAICKDGKLDKEVLEVMREDYVCMYVDLNTAYGKRIAEGLQVASGPAIIVTEPVQRRIVLEKTGELPKAELVAELKKHADRSRADTAEPTSVTPAAAPAASSTIIPASYAPTVIGGPYVPSVGTPVIGGTYAPGFAPAAPVFGGFGGFGGGCPNGRCGR